MNFEQEPRDNILKRLEAPILCANIVWQETVSSTRPAYVITEREGIRIAWGDNRYIFLAVPAHYEGLALPRCLSGWPSYAEPNQTSGGRLVLAYHGGFERDLD